MGHGMGVGGSRSATLGEAGAGSQCLAPLLGGRGSPPACFWHSLNRAKLAFSYTPNKTHFKTMVRAVPVFPRFPA